MPVRSAQVERFLDSTGGDGSDHAPWLDKSHRPTLVKKIMVDVGDETTCGIMEWGCLILMFNTDV